jgi:glutamate---cysteine ligase / carboxylate-amine ligase
VPQTEAAQPAWSPALRASSKRQQLFAPTREYTLGVEEELMLLDPETLALAPAIEPIIAAEKEHGPTKRELMQCQAEVSTRPCRSVDELLEELVALRATLRRHAAGEGALVAGAGTHPFSHAEEQPITAAHRYREMVAALRYPARRTLCYAMHVHVAVGGADKALQIIEALLAELPLLLALSTSSPFWDGEETGLASTRLIVLQTMPRTGLPPVFESWREFESTLDALRRAGAIADATYLWWDVRPQPRFGTVEVRIMDVQPRVEDSAALAGLVQALVRHLGKRYDRGEGFAKANRLVVGENRWLAARHGLRARLVTGAEQAVGARTLIAGLLDRIADDAAALGCEWALERVESIAAEGTSADRQLRLVRHGHSLADVLRGLIDETTRA